MVLDYKDIGQRIKRYRQKRGISQEELATAISITTGHIGKIENGHRYPSLDIIVAIANELHVTADDLLVANLSHVSSEEASDPC